MERPPTIFCLASFFKGNEFIRAAHQASARVVLFTRDKLAESAWAREALDDLIAINGRPTPERYLAAAVGVARHRMPDRIVALEELDVMSAAFLREEFGLPGMRQSTARLFQDKLATRVWGQEEGLAVPEFVHALNIGRVADFLKNVPPPWMLKPRVGASAMGMRRLETADDAWAALAEIDKRDDEHCRPERFLLERYVPGDVYHVDTLLDSGRVVLESVERYGRPPFDIASRGGVATSHTVLRGSDDERTLLAFNRRVLERTGIVAGVTHVEFIRAADDGRFYFLECAARVGGAYTSETVEAATGINLWVEWARIESATPQRPYREPEQLARYGGVAVSLARQETPDTCLYDDPEITYRVHRPFHVGLVVSSSDHDRVVALVDRYAERFVGDFTAAAPLEDSPEHYL